MGRIRDRFDLQIYPGKLKSPDFKAATLYFKYRMDEIAAKYKAVLDDDGAIPKFSYRPYGAVQPDGPWGYSISHWIDHIGDEGGLQAMMAEIGMAMENIKPFTDYPHFSFAHSSARAPWFQFEEDIGYQVNTSKVLEVHTVGHRCRKGNGKSTLVKGASVYNTRYVDTWIEEIYTVGEPTAARKLAGRVRDAFEWSHAMKLNDDILDLIELDNKACMVIKCKPEFDVDPEWLVYAQSKRRIAVDDKILRSYPHYHAQFARPNIDKFQVDRSAGSWIKPEALVELLLNNSKCSVYHSNHIRGVMGNE